MSAAAGPSFEEIARVDVAGFEERFRARRLRAPLVITGVADGWPARDRWTHAYVLERIGAPPLAGNGVSHALTPDLAREVAFLELARHMIGTNVWLVPDGQRSHLHYDLPHNLNTVLRGEKEVAIFAPGEARNLYPWSPLSVGHSPMNSRVDLEHVDASRFPRVARARGWRTTVTTGETLYIPPRFWHYVRSRGESVATNVWFWSDPRTAARRFEKPVRLLVWTALARLRGNPR